jgi:hypothetical protein
MNVVKNMLGKSPEGQKFKSNNKCPICGGKTNLIYPNRMLDVGEEPYEYCNKCKPYEYCNKCKMSI